MGNVNISIDLVGSHNNVMVPEDADRMAAEFVQALKRKGHSIIAARVTSGGAVDIRDAGKYLADCEASDRDAIVIATTGL